MTGKLKLATIDASALALSYRAEILARHELSRKADRDLLQSGLNKTKIARQTGQLILAAQSNLSQTEFEFATDFLTKKQVKGYVRYVKATNLVEDPDTQQQLSFIMPAASAGAMLSGGMPMPQGHGPQQLHEPAFFSWASRTVMQFKAAWAKFLGSKPLDSWTVHEAEQFAFQLRPILGVHKQVTDWIQRQ